MRQTAKLLMSVSSVSVPRGGNGRRAFVLCKTDLARCMLRFPLYAHAPRKPEPLRAYSQGLSFDERANDHLPKLQKRNQIMGSLGKDDNRKIA